MNTTINSPSLEFNNLIILIPNYFCAFGLPIICVLGFVENSLILLVLFRIHTSAELGSTPRFLYTVLAIANLGTIVFTYLMNTFADYGLFFVTGGSAYLSAVDTMVWGCKLVRASNLFWPHVLNWTYLILNLERFYAVLRPLDAHVRFTVRHNVYYLFVIVISGVVLFALALWEYQLQTTWPTVIQTRCLTDLSLLDLMTAFRVLVALDVYIGPNLLSLLASLLLLVTVHLQFVRRTSLQSPCHEEVHNGHLAVNAAQHNHEHLHASHPAHEHLAGALTAVFQALVHSLFFLPAGVMSVLFYEVVAQSQDANVVQLPWLLMVFFIAFSSIGSLADFLIYCARIPSFRDNIFFRKAH